MRGRARAFTLRGAHADGGTRRKPGGPGQPARSSGPGRVRTVARRHLRQQLAQPRGRRIQEVFACGRQGRAACLVGAASEAALNQHGAAWPGTDAQKGSGIRPPAPPRHAARPRQHSINTGQHGLAPSANARGHRRASAHPGGSSAGQSRTAGWPGCRPAGRAGAATRAPSRRAAPARRSEAGTGALEQTARTLSRVRLRRAAQGAGGRSACRTGEGREQPANERARSIGLPAHAPALGCAWLPG